MHVIWHGQACFQIIASRAKGEQISIAIDPFDPTIGLKVPSLTADVLLITHEHFDHNNKAAVKGEPFLISGPGEYEIKEVLIQGIPAFHDNVQGKERGGVTIYTIEAEGMRLCHLSDLGQKELTAEQLQEIGNIDILMVPVGGRFTISAQEAQKVISRIDPRIVVPMHYQIPKLKLPSGTKLDGIEKFLRLMRQKSGLTQPKLLIKQKDLPQEGMKVVVLKP